MAILLAILDFLFGCHHVHLSRVFTLQGETYRVCCDCGAKFAYSLESMSIEHRPSTRSCPDPVSNCLRWKKSMNQGTYTAR
jgi:hypothetical protein